MTQHTGSWEPAELHDTTKRTMAGLSHAVEEIAEAAGADATGATVIVGCTGTAPENSRVHHVALGPTCASSSTSTGSSW